MIVKSFPFMKIVPILGVRHLQVLFLFTCCILSFHQRINLSVGVVAMTNAKTTNPDFPEYTLTERQKAYMLSGIFWGALFTQLLGGCLSSEYGSKMLLLICTFGSSVLSIFLPWTMECGGWMFFFFMRLMQGLCQGVMWPCIYSHLALWCPQDERNRLGGITQTGLDVGTAIGFAVSGLLAASPLGWPSMFYVPGLLGIFWSILWWFYGADSPQDCKFISKSELKLIEQSQELSNSPHLHQHVAVPWRAILTSVPYLVLVTVKMSQASSYHTLMQQLPAYLHGIFGYGIKTNALLSALPFVFMCGMSYACLITVDVLTRRQVASLTVIRKCINTFASWVPAAALLGLAYVRVENIAGSIACLVVAVGAISAQAIGSSLNHIDLAPNYAGILFGISNTMMSLVGVVSPIVVGLVVSDEADRTQWRVIFVGISSILFFGNLLYIFFGQMVVQSWNEIAPVLNKSDVKSNGIAVPSLSA